MTGRHVPGQDNVGHLLGGFHKRSQTWAWGGKLVSHDVYILHSLRVTCGTGYGMVFDRFSFIEDVLLTDKPKSVEIRRGVRGCR